MASALERVQRVLRQVRRDGTEAARRCGVGKALIEAVYTAAAQAGSPRVYWQTRETNATAMRLYDRMAERSGFIVYRRML